MTTRDGQAQTTLPGFSKTMSASEPNGNGLTLGAEAFDNAFPFHLAVSPAGEILQAGHLLRRLLPNLESQDPLDKHFRMTRPRLRRFDAEAFALHDSLQVFLEVKSNGLGLRGAMQADGERFTFLGSPHVSDLSELGSYGLGIDDVAGNELLCEQLLTQHRQAAALAESERGNRELKLREAELLSRTRRLEDQLRNLRESLSQRDSTDRRVREIERLESLGVMAGGLAHDFNNLLMRIQGNTELAMLMLPPEEAVQQQLSEAKNATQAAASLCQRMLDFAGRAPIYVETLDLVGTVERLSDGFQLLCPKNIDLAVDTAREGVRFAGDARQLEQMMFNLVQNSIEAIGSSQGSITVELGTRFFGQSYLDMTRYSERPVAGRYVFFEVCDDGPGMSSEVVDRAFDPFFTTRFLGRGMGLAIVFGIARRHGGCIDLVSEVGEGTTVRVLLPVHKTGLDEQMRLELGAPTRS